MEKEIKSVLTFLDKFLDVPEAKVTYLTKVTFIDRFIQKTILVLLPPNITPNQITKFRLLTIPVIAYLLASGFYASGTVLFLFSAFSDALDGALARTTHQITSWGTLYDPIADKLLISTAAVIIVSKYLGTNITLAIVVIELLLVASSYFRYKGRAVPAKLMGKTKMVLQCAGVILLLFSILFGLPILALAAKYILYLAILFALLSLFVFRSI